VNPAKVVVDEMHRDSQAMIVNLLAEPIGEPGKTAHGHTHREVLPLGMARANLFDFGQSEDGFPTRTDALSRRIALCAVPVDFDQHTVINRTGKESGFNGCQVSVMAICGELHAIGKTRFQVPHKAVCAGSAPISDKPSRDKLRNRVNRNPRPNIARSGAFHMGRHVLGLRVNKAPDFIALDLLTGKVAKGLICKPLAGFSEFNRKVRNCVFGNAGNPNRCADAVALDKAGKHPATVAIGETVHKFNPSRQAVTQIQGQFQHKPTPRQ
jgi:hypothetical protein